MNCVIVRTKLQAVIVKAMVDAKLIVGSLHVVQIYEDNADKSRLDVAYQCRAFAPVTRNTTVLARRKAGILGLFLYFWWLLLASRIRHRRVYFANLNSFSFALALILSPGQKVFSFDDGSANVQRRADSYLSHDASNRRGAGGWIARWLFPRGCASYVRSRIARHCTIYPGADNVVPPTQVDTVEIDWAGMIAENDLSALPKDVTRIFLGSVYPEQPGGGPGAVTQQEVAIAIEWADLHIPHPRQPSECRKSGMCLKYPAEAIISHYAKNHDVVVAHYNSSAALPFRHNSRVHLVDLAEVPVAALRTYSSRVRPSA